MANVWGKIGRDWEETKKDLSAFIEGQTGMFAKMIHSGLPLVSEESILLRHYVLGFLVPTILIFVGMLVPVFTEEFWFRFFAFFPFYSWCGIIMLSGSNALCFVPYPAFINLLISLFFIIFDRIFSLPFGFVVMMVCNALSAAVLFIFSAVNCSLERNTFVDYILWFLNGRKW